MRSLMGSMPPRSITTRQTPGNAKRFPLAVSARHSENARIVREILPGIFTWGGPYPDVPWDLNGYAIQLGDGTVLVDPPEPTAADLTQLDALRPIHKIIITNRSHSRDADLFRNRYRAPVAAFAEEVAGLAPLKVD